MKTGRAPLSVKDRSTFLEKLKARFGENMKRHTGLAWETVAGKLEKDPRGMWSVSEMERTGGEPDVVFLGGNAKDVWYVDCSPESPSGRRSLCYDREALNARKEHKPKNSAMDLAKTMGVEMLTEEDYRKLQMLGEFDLKTSSWIVTPPDIRKLGGAIFCDRRYDTVFTYHNGAESYYAARGFRAKIAV